MQFSAVAVEEALGKVLGHNVVDAQGQRLMRKGKPLTTNDILRLQMSGYSSVYVADLDDDDVGEDIAAKQLAQCVMGKHLHLSGPAGGRANLISTTAGLLRVNAADLDGVNNIEGVTIATLANHCVVGRKQIVATIKIIPFAIPKQNLAQALTISTTPLIFIDPIPAQNVTLILSGSPRSKDRIIADFSEPIRARLEHMGCELGQTLFVPLEDRAGEIALAEHLQKCKQAHDDGRCGMVILAGETAIMDRHDIAPRAIERAGGHIICFGAPVDPGNLLLLAELENMPILGAPGCVRSKKMNIVDWVLPRLLAGDRLTRKDIVSLGVGGLLEEIGERPMPRLG
jgi:molybdenum cofactor cytidylyltransferase